MNIYLDIDGVLLANDHQAAYFADDFLTFILQHFPSSTYWLTTHCWRGRNQAADILAPHLRPKTVKLLERVKPTEWGDLKTDGIDWNKPFFWFDDDLFEEEEAVLRHRGGLECHRHIDLGKDPYQLMDEIILLKQYV